jgi:hypothetical protein
MRVQLVPEDPLINSTQCQLDASLMETIGANSIRVYHVNPDANHTDCMSIFADAGIYLWLDLDTFDTWIDQVMPRWNVTQRNAYAKVMDAFHHFDNLAGFYIGNEVVWSGWGYPATPFVKAAARDMKSYRGSQGYRQIPIGYSNADLASLRPTLQNYLACGDPADAIDFFSLNAYSWCGDSSYEASGYEALLKNSTDYNIPIFFSETGCNKNPPRTFADQAVVFNQMADKWSGSIIHEWIEEANSYGLIGYGPEVKPGPTAPLDGFPRYGTPTPVQPDFDNFSNVWKTPLPTGMLTLLRLSERWLTYAQGVREADYTPTLTPPACPQYTSGIWEINASSPLPTLGQTYLYGAEQATPTRSSGAGILRLNLRVYSLLISITGTLVAYV